MCLAMLAPVAPLLTPTMASALRLRPRMASSTVAQASRIVRWRVAGPSCVSCAAPVPPLPPQALRRTICTARVPHMRWTASLHAPGHSGGPTMEPQHAGSDDGGRGEHADALYGKAAALIDNPGRTSDDLFTARPLLQRAAEAGHLAAQGRYARWLLHGIGGVERSPVDAYPLFARCAQAGDADAQYWCARMLLMTGEEDGSGASAGSQEEEETHTTDDGGLEMTVDDTGVRRQAAFDAAKAVLLEIRAIRKAALKRKKAARKLGLARAEVPRHPGDGSTPAEWKHDEAAAWKLLASAAAQDHQEAQVLLGNLNLQEDPTAAIQWYELAANPVPTDSGEERAPHADALFNLGQIFFDGVHVARDPRLATSYFQRAANGGDASAMYWLGYLHHHGSDECGISQDGAESLRLLSAAADGGHPEAHYYLAVAHLSGDDALGVSANPMVYWRHMSAAVELGSADALFDVGEAHARGLNGLALDPHKGHAKSLCSAGSLLYHGSGVAQDRTRAFELYAAAGEAGSVEGWQNVAAMQQTGDGVPKNEAAAKYILEHVIPKLLDSSDASR